MCSQRAEEEEISVYRSSVHVALYSRMCFQRAEEEAEEEEEEEKEQEE